LTGGTAGRGARSEPVRILRLAAGGDGVARLADGRTAFVPRTAPGDLVELAAVREHRRFVRARPGRLVESGPHRVEPRCPHYVRDDCGGCQLQHLSTEAQLAARSSFVGDALRRLARLDVQDPAIVAAPTPYDYRTKITLTAAGGRLGLHPYERPREVFDLEWCHITVPGLMRLWRVVRELRALLPRGVEQVVLRVDRSGMRHLLAKAGGRRPWVGAARLHAELERRGEPAALWSQAEGEPAQAAAGWGGGYAVTAFEQVHPGMGDRVRAYAVEQLGGVSGRHVWDLYAGLGDTTRRLLEAGASVESVEADRRAVAAADAAGPRAVRHAARAEDVVGRLGPPDLVITNPPRVGMDARVTAGLEARAPERIVYVSCDPATLARDLGRLPSYRLAGVRAFDLFPQTAHVETVAVLERAS
jgi:23S rRNA (uracil1939-C5)-methyltransferase